MSIGQKLLVELSQSTVALLMSHGLHDAETIDNIIERHFKRDNVSGDQLTTPPKGMDAKTTPARPSVQPENYERDELDKRIKPRASAPSRAGQTQKYTLIFLGDELRAATLGHMFVELIESLSNVAPEGVEKLATMKSRKRAFVSRNREAIHPGQSDLKTLKTKNSWWVSANIGRRDFNRALDALCKAIGLTVSKDVRLLS